MSASTGAILRESTDRLTTAAGAALFGLVFLVSLVETVFEHNQAPGEFDEGFQDEFAGDPEAEEFAQAFAEFMETLAASQTVFDIGLSDTLAGALSFLMVFVVGLVWLVGVRAIGEEYDRLDTSLLDGIGWRYLNLVAGAIGLIVAGIIVSIPVFILIVILALTGVGLLLVPFIGIFVAVAAGVALFYWLPAIAIDGENALAALSTSVSVARNSLGATIVLVVLYFLLGIVNFVAFFVLLFSVGPVAPTITSLLIGAVTSVLVIGWMGTGYDLADTVPDESQRPDEPEWERQQSTPDEAWGEADERDRAHEDRGTADRPDHGTGDSSGRDDGGWSTDDDRGDDGGWSTDDDRRE